MTTKYPIVTWVNHGEVGGDDKRWKGTALGYEMDVRYQWSGKWKGHWTAILNHSAIQTGHGEHGYLFDTDHAAKEALVAEMNADIDARVRSAQLVLQHYTTAPTPEQSADR